MDRVPLWWLSAQNMEGMLCHWVLVMQEHDFEIVPQVISQCQCRCTHPSKPIMCDHSSYDTSVPPCDGVLCTHYMPNPVSDPVTVPVFPVRLDHQALLHNHDAPLAGPRLRQDIAVSKA